MPTRVRFAGKTKQGATSIVSFGWHVGIIKAMFINNAPSYRRAHCDIVHHYM
jgi:hypothetical protein